MDEIIDVTDGITDTSNRTWTSRQLLDALFEQHCESCAELFVRTCLEYVEERSHLLSQNGCEESMVRLMQAVRLGGCAEGDNEGGEDIRGVAGPQTECLSRECGDNARVDSLSTSDQLPGRGCTATEARSVESTGKSAAPSTTVLLPNANNGSDSRLYSWGQTMSEVTVTISPKHHGIRRVLRGKDCTVSISRTRLSVSISDQDSESLVIPFGDAELYGSVRVDDCIWNVVDSDTVELSLSKVNEMEWWPCLVVSEGSRIDTTKIQPETTGLNDESMDPEMRKMVEKAMHEQQLQYRQESGTHHEGHGPLIRHDDHNALVGDEMDQAEKERVMKEFMEAHPELDFSEVQINY
jgi:hypothetical protein